MNGDLISRSDDKTIKIWNQKTKKCTATLRGHVRYVLSIIELKNGGIVASASWDKTIKLWDIRKKECIKTLTNHSNLIFCLLE